MTSAPTRPGYPKPLQSTIDLPVGCTRGKVLRSVNPDLEELGHKKAADIFHLTWMRNTMRVTRSPDLSTTLLHDGLVVVEVRPAPHQTL